MQEDVPQFIRGCILCCTSKPINRKQGLYHPIHVPTRPSENISMDFLGGFPTTRKVDDYIFVVVDKLDNMSILTPCENIIKQK
jgi:hypothetical protein